MAFMLSPGVSIQEVDLTTIIPQVSSTAGGYAGFFRWGPVNKRVLIDSESTLASIYQPPNSNNAVFYYSAASFLAYGNNLNVVRANSSGLMNATANTQASIYIPNEDDYFVNHMNGHTNLYGPWFARYPGDLGNSLSVSLCASAEAYSSNLTALYGFTANANAGVNQITTSASLSANLIVGDLIKVGDSPTSNGWIRVTGIQGLLVNTTAGAVSTNGTGLNIIRKWQYADQFNGPPGTSPYTLARSGANDEMHVIVVDANGQFNGSTTNGFVVEKYPFLSKAQDARKGDSASNYYVTEIFNKSRKIYWADHLSGTSNWGNNAQGTTFDAPNQPKTTNLGGGRDITTPYTYTSFSNGFSDTTNDAGLVTAYSYFQSTDDIDVSLIPAGPGSPMIQQYLIDNIAEARRDCVVFLSPRYSDVVDNVQFETDSIINSYLPKLSRSSSYAVVDSGWKYLYDKWNQTYRYVPLNPDVAGLCAYTDTVRDPWYSPAGYNRGAIKNVAKLSWNPSNITGTAYRDVLYTNGVNPVVSFKGQGTVLFGDKTLQARPSAFDRINVRRLFIVLEKSIATAAKYSLFEFNDVFTRNAFINMVEPYLRMVKGRRGIYDYRVVCDETNNPPEIIDLDQFVGDIYVKPSRSINFITLRFVAVGTGVSFEEIVGQF